MRHPVCTFQTSPCMPAPRAHVFQHVRVMLACTRMFWTDAPHTPHHNNTTTTPHGATCGHLNPGASEAQRQTAGHAILCRVRLPEERCGAWPAPEQYESHGPLLGHSKRHWGLRRFALESTLTAHSLMRRRWNKRSHRRKRTSSSMMTTTTMTMLRIPRARGQLLQKHLSRFRQWLPKSHCAYGKHPPKPWIFFRHHAWRIVPMMRWCARVRPLSSHHDLGGSSNFQTRALKTEVELPSMSARLFSFARTHCCRGTRCWVWQMGLSLRGVLGWQMGLSLRPWFWECFEREHTCRTPKMVNHAWQGHIFVVVRSDTDVQIVRDIPLSSWFPPLFPSEQLKRNNFHQVQRISEESAINVLFWTYSQTLNGHDPMVTSCEPPVLVITPRGQILASRTDDSWSWTIFIS